MGHDEYNDGDLTIIYISTVIVYGYNNSLYKSVHGI